MPSMEWNRLWGRALVEHRAKNPDKLFGINWGDPEVRGIRYRIQRLLHPSYGPGPLYKVVDNYIRPYVSTASRVVEIGPGGGRWTRYLVGASKLICVDINPEFFDVLRSSFPSANLEFYQPAGYELHYVDDDSIDFVFSFGTFVHIDPQGIREYLVDIRRVLRPGGVAVIQYSEKRKPAARDNPGFSDMTADAMVQMAPMPILVHDTRMLKHSNIVVFKKGSADPM
jgi:SAM-dependent methyltransferase